MGRPVVGVLPLGVQGVAPQGAVGLMAMQQGRLSVCPLTLLASLPSRGGRHGLPRSNRWAPARAQRSSDGGQYRYPSLPTNSLARQRLLILGCGAFWAIGPALMGGGQLSGPPLGQEKEAQRIPWWERHQAGLSPSFLGTEEEGGCSEEAAPSQAWKVD